MVPPIDVTDINSVEDAKKAIKTGEITEEKAEYIAQALAETKKGKKESKEKEKKVPQFEDKNHRELVNEKIWKIKEEKANIWNGKEYETKKVKVRINPEGDTKEYVSGVPENLIGEQLFSKKALSRLGLLHRLPANKGVIQDMIDEESGKDTKEKYDNFYKKNIKNKLAGYWDPNSKTFDRVDSCMHCWLADGDYDYFGKDVWYCYSTGDDYFFSVRFLKPAP